LTGTLSNAGVAGFGKKLTVANVDQLPLPLDDFKAKVKRGGAFKARCDDADELLNLRGTFAYTGTGQPNDTVNRSHGCDVRVGPPNTEITRKKINQRRRKAKFWFRAIGEATGFQCQLKRKGRRAPDFKGCTSPKVYKHLKRGKRYTFKVRAVGPGGKDETPAKKSFRIRKRR
jgi:hypothetical protein